MQLHEVDAVSFPYGARGCDIINLVDRLMHSEVSIASVWLECKHCQLQQVARNERMSYVIHTNAPHPNSTAGWWEWVLTQPSTRLCNQCVRPMDKVTSFHRPPKILMVIIGDSPVEISRVKLY